MGAAGSALPVVSPSSPSSSFLPKARQASPCTVDSSAFASQADLGLGFDHDADDAASSEEARALLGRLAAQFRDTKVLLSRARETIECAGPIEGSGSCTPPQRQAQRGRVGS